MSDQSKLKVLYMVGGAAAVVVILTLAFSGNGEEYQGVASKTDWPPKAAHASAHESVVAVLPAPATAPEPPPTPAPTPPPTPTPKIKCLKILDLGSKVVKSSGNYYYIAWYVEVQNSCSHALNVVAGYEFQDIDGFKLDSSRERGSVGANSIAKIGDQEMLENSVYAQWEKSRGTIH